MSVTVKIRQSSEGPPRELQVELGETILEAALAADIPYPHGCRSGNCGSCKSELISGDIEMSPYSEHALSPAEKDIGLILACRSVPWSDCEVAWLDADDFAVHAQRRLDCRVATVIDATHDIRILRLEIVAGGPFDYSAGQYASLTFADLPARDFSMAGRPDQQSPDQPNKDQIEFHIRCIAGGTVSGFVADGLAPGDPVRVEGPFGAAFLRTGHRGPIIALAGGSGLAPIKSIVETALAQGMTQPIHLYFGARNEDDVYLEDHFRALAAAHANLRYEVILSEPRDATDRRTGFLHDALATDHHDLDGAKVYLAGPPVMVEAATTVARELGVRRQDCHADAFYTEAEKAKMAGPQKEAAG